MSGTTTAIPSGADVGLTGDVIYLEVFGKPTIVIDSFDAAMDIMEGRSVVTADRPKLVMADLCVPEVVLFSDLRVP